VRGNVVYPVTSPIHLLLITFRWICGYDLRWGHSVFKDHAEPETYLPVACSFWLRDLISHLSKNSFSGEDDVWSPNLQSPWRMQSSYKLHFITVLSEPLQYISTSRKSELFSYIIIVHATEMGTLVKIWPDKTIICYSKTVSLSYTGSFRNSKFSVRYKTSYFYIIQRFLFHVGYLTMLPVARFNTVLYYIFR
jgi:hypothetical protein